MQSAHIPRDMLLNGWFLVCHKRALWSNDWTGPIAIKFCRTTYPGNGRILLKLLPYCPKDCSTMPENVPQKVKIGVPNVLWLDRQRWCSARSCIGLPCAYHVKIWSRWLRGRGYSIPKYPKSYCSVHICQKSWSTCLTCNLTCIQLPDSCWLCVAFVSCCWPSVIP